MSKHVSISKKIAAGLMAGLMLGSFVPVQAGLWGSIKRLGNNIKIKVSAIGSGVDRLWDNIVDTSDNMNVIRENIVNNMNVIRENIVNDIGDKSRSFRDRIRNFCRGSNVDRFWNNIITRGNNIVNDISNRTHSFCRTNKKRILFTGFVAGTLLTMAGLTMLIRGDYDYISFGGNLLSRPIRVFVFDMRGLFVTGVGGLALLRVALSAGRGIVQPVVINNEPSSSGYGESTQTNDSGDKESDDDDHNGSCV